MPTEDLLGTLFGTMPAAALTIVVMSRFPCTWSNGSSPPFVTGIVVLLYRSDPDQGRPHPSVGGGYGALSDGSFASHHQPLSLPAGALGLIVLLQRGATLAAPPPS